MYESPIKVFCTNTELQKLEDEAVFRAVRNLGFLIDKDELIRALRYDRDQYDKGYRDAMDSVVKCEECRHQDDCTRQLTLIVRNHVLEMNEYQHPVLCFCSAGERKDNE